MNYLGTVSILDRGDAPAQAVVDRNARSMAQRVANETKEELEKVMNRVENIYQNFEMTDELYSDHNPNLEFVNDIAELAEILQDQVKKKKYQAQVTVFIVGFQEVSSQKLKLLQQVSEFFTESMKIFDDDEMLSTPDVDLDDVTYKIDETLDVAHGLANRLGEINQEIIDYLLRYAENKAKNKSAQGEGKGKKKLEKALQAAKDDMTNLSEKLLSIQSDLEDKEEKMQQLYKQLEIKTLENQKYKSAAEIAKKNLLDSQALKEEISNRDNKIKDMRQIISRLEIDLTQARHSHEQSQNRLENSSMESQQKLLELQKGVDGSKLETNEAKREMEKLHESQINKMLESHSKEIDELKEQHQEEINKLTEEIESLRQAKLNLQKDLSDIDHGRRFELDLSESSQSRQSSRQDSRSGSRSSASSSKQKNKGKSKVGKEASDLSTTSDGDNTADNKRSKSTLETVREADNFENSWNLLDEESWGSVPASDVPGRYNQYRKLSQNHIKDLEDKLQLNLARMHRKVQTLKTQFQEHKSKWDAERQILMDQVQQAQYLQTDAEKEADSTITQLENFITEQERLELEEAKKRQEMAASAGLLKEVAPRSVQPSPNEDLNKLMQQTDDAKALASTVPAEMVPEKKNIDAKELPDGGSIEDDDFRISSAKSRHSLRSHYKSKIQETKKAAEDRKYKAAALSKSITQVKDEEEKIIDEDHEDYLKGFGYSVTGELLPEHPVVQEYLKSHNSTISFKEALIKILLDKDMMSASQLISDLEIHHFKKEAKIFPQLEKMTKNTSMVLDEIISLLNSILFNDRDPPVSSMMYISRDPTCMSREKTPDTSRTPAPTRESIHSNVYNQGVDNVDNEYIRDLQHQCHLLKDHLDETSKKHEEQLRHNTVVMMEMQDTINGLQRELSTLGKAPRSRSVTPRLQLSQAPSPESSIMFTRLDAERNAKIMKKAVNDAKLDQNKYKDAVSQMDKYISLPAQRLAHLVQKYVHHYRMKYIEETVQKSRTLDDDVFDVLDKMEDLQNQRAKRWADKMDEMGTERLRMANLLMETLDSIENESGIFLIKPMYSYRGRELLQRYTGKLSRPIRSRKANSSTLLPENLRSFGPAPTPASNIRSIHREVSSLQNQDTRQLTAPSPKGTFDGTDGGVAGAAVNWVGTSSNSTWNMSASQPSAVKDDISSFHNTPRILELDINRMLIGQNNISTRLCYPLTDDRLVNASQNTLRTYVTVNRPAVQPKGQDRPHSVTGARDSCAPPTTPQQISSSTGISEVDVPQKLPSTPPLPPISKTRNISASSSRPSPSLDGGIHIKHGRSYSGKSQTTSDED
ncbi:myosin-11 isoform X3 [Patella vulgata]|uniref:myosin-11 isoform X3 n=1 Tax=Patella vulgata TaxID=6465 RepID=UPI0024A9BA87|nr:myosin-11 isoform X3 [Patella vulgata]